MQLELCCFSEMSNNEKRFQALLDRGFGKPKVEIQNTNADFRDALEEVQSRLLERSHSGHNNAV